MAESISRRRFLAASGVAVIAGGCQAIVNIDGLPIDQSKMIIDIHQHTGYLGRSDEELLAHQENMGVVYTILLPSGHPVERPSTHMGKSNGLAAKCLPNETCYRIAQDHPGRYYFFANEVPDVENAREEVEKYLKLGAKGVGEVKYNIDVESPAFDVLAGLATDYNVPMLCHFQLGMFNHGFDRFWRVLEKYPKTKFIGHAQTMWTNVSKVVDAKNLYPKTEVQAGGLTDQYLRNYENFYADISAGSGLNSLMRDEARARAFLHRHQDKIMYGSDCADRTGKAPLCQGADTIIAVRRLSVSKGIAAKILYENAGKLFGIPMRWS
jgi:predicted TIM-barrel fold metal-dependent hydrolase